MTQPEEVAEVAEVNDRDELRERLEQVTTVLLLARDIIDDYPPWSAETKVASLRAVIPHRRMLERISGVDKEER